MYKKILTLAIAICGLCGLSTMAQTEAACANAEACQAQGNKMYQPQLFTDYAFEGILLEPAQQAKVDAINAQMKDMVNGNVRNIRAVRNNNGVCPDSAQCKNKCNANCECKKGECKKGECKDQCKNKENCPKATQCPNNGQAECQNAGQCPKQEMDRHHRNGMRGEGNQVNEARKAYAQKMKEVLTPDQYVMFLENIAFAPQEQPQMGFGHRQVRNPRGARQ